MQRKLKRNKLEIFNDILQELQKESHSDEIKPTRIQQKCNMSYDKFSKNIEELEQQKLISQPSLHITDKGLQFLKDYSKIGNFLDKMKLNYLNEGITHNEI